MITRLNWRAAAPERNWAMVIISVCIILLTALIFWPRQAVQINTNTQAIIKQHNPVVQLNLPIEKYHITSKPVATALKKNPPTPHPPKKINASHSHHKAANQTGYFIQIGAFRDSKRAKSLQAKLIKKHWRVSISPTKNHLYSVKIGAYSSKKTAQKAMLKLLHSEKIKGFITHHQAHAKH